MRVFAMAALLGTVVATMWPAPPARAWWDAWGRWHPNYYRPYYAPPPVAYYPPPPHRWLPPHYDAWGRWIPGHWA